MKAGPKMFEAVALLVRNGLSPSRAAKALRISPDTVSRWRREHPEFAVSVDESESRFIAKMIGSIAKAAATDWRAAEALLARRFPVEFARDNAAVQFALNVNTEPTNGLDEAIENLRNSPAAAALMQQLALPVLNDRPVDSGAPRP